MARKCQISGKGPMTGNNVSHANNKTKRRFLPNLRTVRVPQEDGTFKTMRISASALRTMRKQEAKADETKEYKTKTKTVKNRIAKKLAKKQEASA
jgi:large subunit ribosomal protein L28